MQVRVSRRNYNICCYADSFIKYAALVSKQLRYIFRFKEFQWFNFSMPKSVVLSFSPKISRPW